MTIGASRCRRVEGVEVGVAVVVGRGWEVGEARGDDDEDKDDDEDNDDDDDEDDEDAGGKTRGVRAVRRGREVFRDSETVAL
jgi:hypothetical protein